LNDADDDDVDVYDHSSSADRMRTGGRHLAFDESEAADDFDRTLASHPRDRGRQDSSRTITRTNGLTGHAELFSNSAPVLLGFELSKLSVTDDQWCVLCIKI
jgi:hypothetical protein